MNPFVRLYVNSVNKKLSFETREKYYRITASVIAKTGTIEDLQALDHFYENEEENINEENTIVEFKIG